MSEPRPPVRCAVLAASPLWVEDTCPQRRINRWWLVSIPKSIQVSSHNFIYLRVKRNGVCSQRAPAEELGVVGGVVSGHEGEGVPLKRWGLENRKVCQSRAWHSPHPDPGPDTSFVTLRRCHYCSAPRLSRLRVGGDDGLPLTRLFNP